MQSQGRKHAPQDSTFRLTALTASVTSGKDRRGKSRVERERMKKKKKKSKNLMMTTHLHPHPFLIDLAVPLFLF